MIGDGSNDSLAIREANMGISFTSADASFSAPYSSRSPSIECVKQVLLEGKNMYSICCEIMLYQSINTMIRFAMVEILSLNYSIISDFQFTFVSFFLGASINQILMLCSFPVQHLTKQFLKVDLKIFGIRGISSTYGRLILAWLGMGLIQIALKKDASYVGNYSTAANDKLIVSCQENTAQLYGLLLFSISSCFIVYQSSPIKKTYFRNYPLLISSLLNFAYCTYILFTDKVIFDQLELKDLDDALRGKIAAIIFAAILLMYLYEELVVRKLLYRFYSSRENKNKLKFYERLLE